MIRQAINDDCWLFFAQLLPNTRGKRRINRGKQLLRMQARIFHQWIEIMGNLAKEFVLSLLRPSDPKAQGR